MKRNQSGTEWEREPGYKCTGKSYKSLRRKGGRILLAIMACTMVMGLTCGCNSEKEKTEVDTQVSEPTVTEPEVTDPDVTEPAVTEPAVTESSTAESEVVTPTATPEPTTNDSGNTDANGLRSDFKAAMDSYESFMNDYAAFMKKYAENPSDTSLLSDYSDFMSKYAEMMSTFEQWENEDLSDAELAYYLEVQTRVNAKLAEVAGY